MLRLASLAGLALLLLLASPASYGQSSRLNDHNTIGWFVYSGDHKVSEKWALHTEYQWRRINWLRTPQNQLARVGLVRQLGERVKVSAGYTYFQTHRYGAYPAVTSQFTPEHRLYEDVTLENEPLGRLTLSHRFRFDHRWLGSRPEDDGRGDVTEWGYQNRIRYQISGEFALQGPRIDDGEWYLNAFDELFISFGRNVGNNVFNQNRLSAGLGYQFTQNAKLELNYLYIINQHASPDPETNRPVFELNQGFRLNVLYDLDFTGGGQ